jgi:hypothetical protein
MSASAGVGVEDRETEKCEIYPLQKFSSACRFNNSHNVYPAPDKETADSRESRVLRLLVVIDAGRMESLLWSVLESLWSGCGCSSLVS